MTGRKQEPSFRAAMRRMLGAVSLVTTVDPVVGAPAGLVASAVIPISMDPPSMLISVNNAASAHGPIARTGRFCINVLAADQMDLVAPFADGARRHERFLAEGWSRREGIPYLPDSCAAIFCAVRQQVPFGTHCLFIGEVVFVAGREGHAPPLGWIEGQFATVAPVALHQS